MKLNQVDELLYAIELSLFRLDIAQKNEGQLKEIQFPLIQNYLNEIKENLEWERTTLENMEK